MKTTFIRALALSALLQFILTRQRAGNAIEEGAAEAMWVRYPVNVLLNAIVWTLTLAALGAGVRQVRRLL